MSESVSAISLRSVSKKFSENFTIHELSLSIAQNEFVSILGPSGSGKTTLLRLIAGFEKVSSGTIELFGEDVTSLTAHKRPVNTVFQDYALFPHMTALENVAFGLRVRGVNRQNRFAQAREMLETLQLKDFADRKTDELSGGQRQRVALARALILQPKVLLLDEPFGALDAKLREKLQLQLKTVQRQLGVTFIFVTHDQAEALSLSDRIIVLNEGRIQQMASPQEIYEKPENAFVADFVGSSNIFEDHISRVLFARNGSHAIRQECLSVGHIPPSVPGSFSALATIVDTIYSGNSRKVVMELDVGSRVIAHETLRISGNMSFVPGERVVSSWHERDVIAFRDATLTEPVK